MLIDENNIQVLSKDAEEGLTGGFAVLQQNTDSDGTIVNSRKCINGNCEQTKNTRVCKNEISCAGAINSKRCHN